MRLGLTVYDARRRFLRRGYWSRWELRADWGVVPTYQVSLASGWARSWSGWLCATFDVGEETARSALSRSDRISLGDDLRA